MTSRKRDVAEARATERDEAKFVAAYRPGDYPRPAVSVDLVIFTIEDAVLKILLIQRNEHPFKGRWALPGGFVRVGESQSNQGEGVDEAAARELAEETGLPAKSIYLRQLHTFGRPGRDPRMRVISVAYVAFVRPTLVPFVRAGGDAAHAKWFAVSHPELKNLRLAFDHSEIAELALRRVRDTLDTSDIAFELVPETFTVPELRAACEVVKGEALDPGNFRKRFTRMLEDGVITAAPGKRITASKPAKVYHFTRRA
jgi:8-oxo-dGTP diphosphatase